MILAVPFQLHFNSQPGVSIFLLMFSFMLSEDCQMSLFDLSESELLVKCDVRSVSPCYC